MRHRADQDRNFDDLADRFVERIYGSYKGALRLEILWRDLELVRSLLPDRPWRILDAGGGSGHFSSQLAYEGHEVVLCDLSEQMVKKAEALFAKRAPDARVDFVHSPVQQLTASEVGDFDLILSHAVLEWVVQPLHMLNHLLSLLRPDAPLSLMYYNKDAAMFRNLLYGHLERLPDDEIRGDKKSLTPFNPMPQCVESDWFARKGFTLLAHSGIRCFSDYLIPAIRRDMNENEIYKTEIKLSRVDPYRSFGRYVHKIYRKCENPPGVCDKV